MPPASEVRQGNPDHLTSSDFLVNLAVSFNVTSIPLAIFILIVVCIACILLVVMIFFIVRSCLRQKYVTSKRRKGVKTIYVDEIPGIQSTSTTGNLGYLEYSLEYLIDHEELRVGVLQANGLVPRPGQDEVDPYVSVTMTKTIGRQMKPLGTVNKTNVRRRTNRPVWQQQFTYDLSEADLRVVTLIFEVYDYDSIGQDSSIGRLAVALRDLDQSEYAGKILEKTGYLTAGPPLVSGVGEMCIGLGYYPENERIDVTIYEAKDLHVEEYLSHKRENRLIVQVELHSGRSSLKKEETKPKTDTVNPYFDEKMSFSLKSKKVEQCSIVCHLARKRRVRGNKVMGEVRLGMSSLITTGIKHWEQMIKVPMKTHVMWHAIVLPSNGSV